MKNIKICTANLTTITIEDVSSNELIKLLQHINQQLLHCRSYDFTNERQVSDFKRDVYNTINLISGKDLKECISPEISAKEFNSMSDNEAIDKFIDLTINQRKVYVLHKVQKRINENAKEDVIGIL